MKNYLALLISLLVFTFVSCDDDEVITSDCILVEMLESGYNVPSTFLDGKIISFRGMNIEYDDNGKMIHDGFSEFKYDGLGNIVAYDRYKVTYVADTIVIQDSITLSLKPTKLIMENGKVVERINHSPGSEDIWHWIYEYSDDFQNLENFKLYNNEYSSSSLGYLLQTFTTSNSVNPASSVFTDTYYLNFMVAFGSSYPLENIHLFFRNNIASVTIASFESVENRDRTCEGPNDAINNCYPNEIPINGQYGGETIDFTYDCSGLRLQEVYGNKAK